MTHDWKVGDEIEVFEPSRRSYPVRGKIVDLDLHPFEYGDAEIEVTASIAFPIPRPRLWVSLRMARKV
jgi:hypothetical protein